MDDVPLCPPWWPSFLWWILRHHVGPPPPPNGNGPIYDKERAIEATEQILVGLQTFHYSSSVASSIRSDVRESGLGQIAKGLEQLSASTRG